MKKLILIFSLLCFACSAKAQNTQNSINLGLGFYHIDVDMTGNWATGDVPGVSVGFDNQWTFGTKNNKVLEIAVDLGMVFWIEFEAVNVSAPLLFGYKCGKKKNVIPKIGILGGGQFLNDNKNRKELMVGPCTELTIDKKKVSYSIRYFFDPVTSSKMHEVVFIVGIK